MSETSSGGQLSETSSGGQLSRLKDFTLPDLGEGLTEGEILQWMVKVGDTVTLNQPIVEVETAKAAVEVPSPYAGLVTHIHHAAGETVDVGSPIVTFDTDPLAGPLEAAAGSIAAGAFANRWRAQPRGRCRSSVTLSRASSSRRVLPPTPPARRAP